MPIVYVNKILFVPQKMVGILRKLTINGVE